MEVVGIKQMPVAQRQEAGYVVGTAQRLGKGELHDIAIRSKTIGLVIGNTDIKPDSASFVHLNIVGMWKRKAPDDLQLCAGDTTLQEGRRSGYP